MLPTPMSLLACFHPCLASLFFTGPSLLEMNFCRNLSPSFLLFSGRGLSPETEQWMDDNHFTAHKTPRQLSSKGHRGTPPSIFLPSNISCNTKLILSTPNSADWLCVAFLLTVCSNQRVYCFCVNNLCFVILLVHHQSYFQTKETQHK